MSSQFNVQVNISGAGGQIAQSLTRTADSGVLAEPAIPAGLAGTLSTRTDNDTGILTVATGHGITTSNKVDVYWSGGMRYGMTVTAVSATTISIDVGAGTNLPIATTVIVVSPQIQCNLLFDGDLAALVALKQKYDDVTVAVSSHADFQDASNASVVSGGITLLPNGPQVWDITGGSANPFSGNIITHVMVSNGCPTAAAVFQIMVLQDSTP